MSVLFAREGAAVAISDIDQESAEATAEFVRAEGTIAEVIVADAADEDAAAETFNRASESLGGLDGLVLNVGTAQGARIAGTSVDDWETTFAVNLRAHFLVCQAALPNFADGGSIVFISSVAGIRPGSGLPAYDTSKAALGGLCRHVAHEGARRLIRANVVAPGLIDTPLGRLASAGRSSRDRTPVPLQRQGTAWEIAYPTVFLLSDEASYITGQTMVVDGGLTALR
jgi:NAD(P)-dependent dehydrogenase (short-subunit alcohol dehydrogenase family)